MRLWRSLRWKECNDNNYHVFISRHKARCWDSESLPASKKNIRLTIMAINYPYHRIWRPMIGYNWMQMNWENLDAPVRKLDYLGSDDFVNQQEMCTLVTTAHLIIQDLYELFNYVEPNDICLNTYSHRLYELLLRSATEFEANCKAILDANGYVKHSGRDLNVNDYYKIEAACKLSGYSVCFGRWPNHDFKPFEAWNSGTYIPLPWYQGYNHVKHNRYANFHVANLENVMNGIAGLLCILHAQFGDQMITACYEGFGMMQEEQEKVATGTFVITTPSFSEAEKYDFTWDDSKGVKVPVLNYTF